MIVDFHSHTSASDGTLEPAQLADAMKARGVAIFSVTDHDSLAAYAQLDGRLEFAKLIVGVEINSTYRGNEVHILGYGFPADSQPVRELLEANRGEREARSHRMVEQLQRVGLEITPENVRAEAGSAESALGRPHVAKALVRAGFAPDIESAFRQYLVRGKPGYVPQLYIRPQDAVRAIARAGGVPVLAHPGRLDDDRDIIEELVAAGLVGIEVFYPTHAPAQVARYRSIAAEHGLVMTAGSDFHDIRWNTRGVGMDVEREDITAFLELVG
ncbi:MAG: phosphatase [Vulcanimicrobiaceae bacterium]